MEPRVIVLLHGDDAVRASMQFMLEAHGWNVVVFRSSAELLQSWAPSCLIVDEELPDMPGFELIEQIRKRGLTAPAVLTTSRVDPQICARAKDQGTVLVDALEPDKLLAVLRAALGVGSGTGAGVEAELESVSDHTT